jgi:hypothetical protein
MRSIRTWRVMTALSLVLLSLGALGASLRGLDHVGDGAAGVDPALDPLEPASSLSTGSGSPLPSAITAVSALG